MFICCDPKGFLHANTGAVDTRDGKKLFLFKENSCEFVAENEISVVQFHAQLTANYGLLQFKKNGIEVARQEVHFHGCDYAAQVTLSLGDRLSLSLIDCEPVSKLGDADVIIIKYFHGGQEIEGWARSERLSDVCNDCHYNRDIPAGEALSYARRSDVLDFDLATGRITIDEASLFSNRGRPVSDAPVRFAVRLERVVIGIELGAPVEGGAFALPDVADSILIRSDNGAVLVGRATPEAKFETISTTTPEDLRHRLSCLPAVDRAFVARSLPAALAQLAGRGACPGLGAAFAAAADAFDVAVAVHLPLADGLSVVGVPLTATVPAATGTVAVHAVTAEGLAPPALGLFRQSQGSVHVCIPGRPGQSGDIVCFGFNGNWLMVKLVDYKREYFQSPWHFIEASWKDFSVHAFIMAAALQLAPADKLLLRGLSYLAKSTADHKFYAVILPEHRFGIAVEEIFPVEGEGIYVAGWRYDPDEKIGDLVLVSADGKEVVIQGDWVWNDRPDVAKELGADSARLGFVVFHRMPEAVAWPIYQIKANLRRIRGFTLSTPAKKREIFSSASMVGVIARTRAGFDPVMFGPAFVALGTAPAQVAFTASVVPTPASRRTMSVLIALTNWRGRAESLHLQLQGLLPWPAGDEAEIIVAIPDGERARRLGAELERFEALYKAYLTILAVAPEASWGATINAGLGRCGNEHVVLLSDSVIPTATHCVPTLVETLRRSPDTAAVGGLLLSFDGRIVSAGLGTVRDALGRTKLQHRLAGNWPDAMGVERTAVEAAATGALCFRLSDVARIGGYPDVPDRDTADFLFGRRMAARNRQIVVDTRTSFYRVPQFEEMYRTDPFIKKMCAGMVI